MKRLKILLGAASFILAGCQPVQVAEPPPAQSQPPPRMPGSGEKRLYRAPRYASAQPVVEVV